MITLNSGHSFRRLCPLIIKYLIPALVIILFFVGSLQIGFTMAKKPPFNKFFISGETHFVTKCVFGKDQSVCKISGTGTSLDATNICYDTNVKDETIELEFFINTGHIRFKDKTINKNPIFEIRLDKNKKLNQPVKISIPYHDDNDRHPITGLYIKKDGGLSSVLTTPPEICKDQVKRFSIFTFHSGIFSWIGKL